jgi:PAS domain S-box-containing protein
VVEADESTGDSTQKPLILLVEDEPAHSEAMTRALSAQDRYRIGFATTLAAAQIAILRERPALVLADLNLRDGKAFELLSEPGSPAALPVLVLTSHGDEHAAVRAMRLGALDYLVKSAEAFAELPHAVERALREWRLIESRRIAEAALRDGEERFRVLFESAPDSCYMGTRDGRCLDINRAAEELIGYRRDEVIGRSAAEMGIIHPAHLERAIAMVAIASESGAPSPLTELVILHKSGREIVIETRVVPVRLKDSDIFLSTSRDITARKQAEEERSRLEEQLRQASKMEAVGRLAGGVAHDFNNILTGIRGFTDLILRNAKEDAAARGDLLEIQRATDRAAALTGQLLAFSRKQVIDPAVVDLNRLVYGALRILERLIGEDIELSFAPGAERCAVRVDPNGIEQVLINLAVNARDAMPNGGALRIATEALELDAAFCAEQLDAHEGAHALLTVSDTGSGMSEPVLSHLFEPFFTTKGPGRGTGLGLSIIYGIVQQCGGFVRVESALGKGSTFRIYLPLAAEPPAASARPSDPDTPGGSETILLVEDEVLVRELVDKFLRDLGYSVLSASRGSEALELAAQSGARIDLLLSDVILPRMNGRQIYEKLHELRPDLRVLFMSGYTQNIIAPHGVLEAEFQFLQKPFSLRELAQKVRAALVGTLHG